MEKTRFDINNVPSLYVCACGFEQKLRVPLGVFVRVPHDHRLRMGRRAA